MADRSAPLPDYEPLQRAFHRAFEPELSAAIEALTVSPGSRILDVPCGDGFFARRLKRRLGGLGSLLGVDCNETYLKRARRRIRGDDGCSISFRSGDVYSLPCPDAGFDLAWCAFSFISLDDPVRALREMGRAIVPGGIVAVLESDEYHHVLLPWPVDLEVALQRAIHDACRRKYGRASRLSPARKVNRMLREAGLEPLRKTTIPADRQAPFADDLQRFLQLHLTFLGDLATPHLKKHDQEQFRRFTDPDEETSIFQLPEAEVTCLSTLYRARRPT